MAYYCELSSLSELEHCSVGFTFVVLHTMRLNPCRARFRIDISLMTDTEAELVSRVRAIKSIVSRPYRQEEYVEMYDCVDGSNRGKADSFHRSVAGPPQQ